MKKKTLWISTLFTLLLCMLLLTSCSASAENNGEATAPPQESPTLSELLGADYQSYVTETITMQMGNRMDKNPEVRYFPIVDDAPLGDYVTIDETTKFEVEEEGNVVIFFPAGTVTDEAHGEQSFRIPKL